jgi:hypothetical protein
MEWQVCIDLRMEKEDCRIGELADKNCRSDGEGHDCKYIAENLAGKNKTENGALGKSVAGAS